MKFTLNAVSHRRAPVAFLRGGQLHLPFKDRRTDQRNCILSKDGLVEPNGTGTVDAICHATDTPLYEGDTLTITF